ncbi:unnamed protein product, partial [marine sediment metagenome]
TEFVRDVPLSKVVHVASIMREPGLVLYSGHEPKIALHAMQEQEVEFAFVVDSRSQLRGVINLDEVKEAISHNVAKLDEVVKESPLQVGPDQPIEEVIPLSASSDNPIAVVDEDGKLIGEVPHVALLEGMSGRENNNDSAR